MAKTDIQVDDLVITYNKGKSNEFNALQHVNAEIYPREYIILFGPSGCGKSTLLYTMLGGIPPESGHMNVKGEDIYAYTPAELNAYQQSTIGIVYQQFNLISSISVLDNVALPMIFLNRSTTERNARGSELLRKFGIPQRLEDKLPTFMSGGQQQRVAVARALVNDPEILLADEPVGNLDSISAHSVMESFREVNEIDRKTVILVTHNAAHLPYAHRVFYMRDGVMRRIAVNPAKPQVKRLKPGDTIVTEIEQLTRLYPYAESIELKVKSIVNFATQTINFDQIERLEEGMLPVLKGVMDDTMFYEFLVKPYQDGGIGMHDDEARTMTKRVFTLLKYSHDVERFRADRHLDGAFMKQHAYVDHILQYITLELGITSSGEQEKALRLGVADRVGGITTSDEFAKRLLLPLGLDGAAFTENQAYLISRYLEKLVAQGGYVIMANELEGAHS